MEHISLMERFADPELFTGLTIGEKMIGGGVTTLIGMGITFVILILLALIIVIMDRLIENPHKKDKEPVAGKTEIAPAPPVAAATTEQDSGPLIAVITAAIAALEGSGVASNLVVRKINRTAGPALAWSVAGQQDAIASRKR